MDIISGRWSFTEDFEFGKDKGFADLYQEDEKITGVLIYTEKIKGETPFRVQQNIQGVFNGKKLKITGTAVKILDSETKIDYHLDTWEGVLNTEKQIVGHSYDNHDCFGIFIMEMIQ